MLGWARFPELCLDYIVFRNYCIFRLLPEMKIKIKYNFNEKWLLYHFLLLML